MLNLLYLHIDIADGLAIMVNYRNLGVSLAHLLYSGICIGFPVGVTGR
jgi:hypothetical protein